MTGGVTLSDVGFEVDAGLIASSFGLDPSGVPGLMREGAITSRCETGVEDDAGRWRLTFFHAGRALRLTVDGTGDILQRATFDVPGRRGQPQREDRLASDRTPGGPSGRKPE